MKLKYFLEILSERINESESHQNNRKPYWYAECETLYRTLLQRLKIKHDSILSAIASLTKLNGKMRDQWFRSEHLLSHSRRKAWRC